MIKVKVIVAAALAAACLISFCSCGSRTQGVERVNGDTVLELKHTESDFSISFSDTEYDYYYLNFLAEGIGADEAAENTLAELKRLGAIFSVAAEYEVTLDKDDREEVGQNIESLVGSFEDDEDFDSALAEYNMTRELYTSLSQINMLETNLREYVIDEASGIIKSDDVTVESDIAQNFIAAKQILISNDDGDDSEENRFLANDILAKLEAGEDFDALVEEYGEDENMDAQYGRYFTHGMFPDEFEEAALSLGEGELSGVIESDVGFHIILRMPIDDEYVEDNFETLRYYYLNRVFNEMLEERAGEFNAEYNDR